MAHGFESHGDKRVRYHQLHNMPPSEDRRHPNALPPSEAADELVPYTQDHAFTLNDMVLGVSQLAGPSDDFYRDTRPA